MSTGAGLITAQEYFTLTEGQRWTELIDGRIVVNVPRIPHQTLVGRLHLALGNWVEEEPGRGRAWLPLDVIVDDHNVLAPDLVWVAEERLPEPGAALLARPPDLLVEVRSPSTWHRDIGVKRRLYERHGVAELWLVDGMGQSVIVCRRSDPGAPIFDVESELDLGEMLGSAQLPGFGLELDALFAEA
ncbi:MAG: Uma2 family endonuclease [Solirubrobacteraceae bacterium]